MPFVPKKIVCKCFEKLKEECEASFHPILHYFDKNYLGLKKAPKSKFRINPLFPVAVWNLYDRVLCHAARSNNQIEAWHKHFDRSINSHPTISKFLANLRKEINLYESFIFHVDKGEISLPKAKEKRKTMRIEYVVNDFDENNFIGFLDKMIIAIETNDKLNENANILKEFNYINLETVELF